VTPEFTSTTKITQETLPAFFECLHNLLWNQAGLSPERALEHMTFFFAYRLIEGQTESLQLPVQCRWSYISTLTNETELFEAIKIGVREFHKRSETKPFFRPHEIKKESIVFEIVQQINRITPDILQQSDTLGDIFEYMLGRGMSTMADEGQYFTKRAICKIAFELAYGIKKTLRRPDGTLCTFADWFCGTGGFPVEFIKGVKTHDPILDWKRDSESIYCQDMSMSSVTTTLLNMLINTGVPFNDTKIKSSNSFTESITSKGASFEGLTVDYCFMNPPYGGDKTKGKEYKFAYSKKIKEDGKFTTRFCVNPEIQSIGIQDDDKVSAGVQLSMATLSEGGVCCIVLPQGFFFGVSKKIVELRKKLAEEYKISHVVDIASGTFKNTGTKTSMMVYQKGVGPTEQIEFVSLQIQENDYEQSRLITCTLEELRTKNYSLNYKQYLPQTIVEIEGFEMVKLGELVTINTGKNKTPDDKKGTLYPYYGTSEITGYTDNYLEDGEYILTARNGTIGNTFLIEGKSYPSDHMFVLRTNHRCNLKYLYYWMISNKNVMGNLSNVTTIPGITRASLVEIKIPLPSLDRQKQIVEAIDGWADLVHQEESSLKLLEKQVMFQVKEMGRGQPRVKLNDVCDIKPGKSITKKDLQDGNVPVIGGGVSPMGYHTIHNSEAYSIIVSQVGSAGTISRYPVESWITNNGMTIHPKNITNDYLYYTLKSMEDTIKHFAEGTAQPKLSSSSLLNIEIPLTSLIEQQTLQPEFMEIRHKHEKIIRYKEKAQEAIQRLIPS
jgi:type I restriction-modification system DNA methylase subunit